MSKCQICFQELTGDSSYHKNCLKSLFSTTSEPILDYSLSEMQELARQIVERSVSIPGAQAKISLAMSPRKSKAEKKLTIIGLWGEYILKPPSIDYPELPENEALTMKMANIYGIKTAKSGLIKLKSGELAYITKRMDREKNSKIHFEDMCQLSGRLTEDKYKGSMEQICKIIEQYSTYSKLDLIRFFELSLYSFICGNADMHLKNFSLMYSSPNEITLSPAYDLISTRLIIPKELDDEELALSLCGRKKSINIANFSAFAEKCGINQTKFGKIISHFISALEPSVKLINQSFLSEDLKSKYISIISERTARLATSDPT